MGIGTFTNLGTFGQTFGGSYEVPAYEGFVEPTSNGLMDLLQESAHDAYQLEAALYVANVVHEQATMESAQQAELVFESVVSDTIAKLKKIFMDMWARVKSWFAAVLQRIKMLFQSGEKFISANKKALEAKNVLGFKYKGYEITFDKGVAKSNTISDDIEKRIREFEGMLSADAIPAGKVEESLADYKERILSEIGFDNVAEMKKAIVIAFHNDEEDTDEIEDFGKNSKQELMDLVKNANKTINAVNKEKARLDKQFNAIIKKLDGVGKEIANSKDGSDAERGAKVMNVNRGTKVIQYLMTLMTAAAAASVEGVQFTAKHAESVLKKYLTYKPTKESAVDEEFDQTLENLSILDRAMKLI